MKSKLILTASIVFAITFSSLSQTVNGKLISEIDVQYVQIVGTSKFLSTKVSIQINFGQEHGFFDTKKMQIKDKEGKTKSFNSMIDALNFMSKNGYDFVTAYAVTVSNQNVYHYLLKKRK